MKILGRFLKIFLLLIILVFVAILAFVATFDANNYKPQITEQVENATGRDFAINGDINLSVFPWVGIKIEDVVLGNEKGFKSKHFARVKQLDVKVNVLPLLRKEVEINVIRLHGLDVSLEVAKNKHNNWSNFSAHEEDGRAHAETAAAEKTASEATSDSTADKAATGGSSSESGSDSSLKSLKVEGFEFVDAVIQYDDRSTNTKATVSELNLETSAITFDEPVDIKFSTRIVSNQPAIDTRLTMATKLTFDKDFTEIDLKDFVFTVIADAREFLPQPETIEIRSDIKVLMEEQRVTIKQLKLSALGTTTVADITVAQFSDDPVIQGAIEVQPFNAREVAKRVAVELPEMARGDALNKVAIKTKIKLYGEKFQANDFSLTLDDSTLSGWIHLLDISKQQLRYDLTFDQLNLNDYMPPVSEAVAAEAGAGSAASGSEGPEVAEASTGDEKIELPLEMMRTLDIQGDFRITALTAKEYQIKQFLLSTKAQKGIIDIKPLSMQVLEGQVVSEVRLNVKKDIPAYAIKLDVNQIQAGPVVNPFLVGVMGDKPLTMEGAVNFDMDVKTSGDTVNRLKKASKGKIILDMKQTQVKGFDPEYYMRSSVAKYVDSKGFGMSKTIMGDYKPREVTVFDVIYSTVKLADGKARTKDFLMDSKRVKVKADGFVDIMKDSVDMNTSVELARSKTALEKILDEPLYVRVYGPFDALEYKIDTNRLKKSTTDVLKNEAKAKLDAEKKRLKAKAKAEEQRLRDRAKAEEDRARARAKAEEDRLKEKAKAEQKRAEEKAKNKLKDKLKGLF